MADYTIDRTEIRDAVLGERIVVERRRSDGMVWLRVGEPIRGTQWAFTAALDPDEAWAVAQAMLSEPEPHDVGAADG